MPMVIGPTNSAPKGQDLDGQRKASIDPAPVYPQLDWQGSAKAIEAFGPSVAPVVLFVMVPMTRADFAATIAG
jgi:hypothetical protein